jgi:hypothetical protein
MQLYDLSSVEPANRSTHPWNAELKLTSDTNHKHHYHLERCLVASHSWPRHAQAFPASHKATSSAVACSMAALLHSVVSVAVANCGQQPNTPIHPRTRRRAPLRKHCRTKCQANERGGVLCSELRVVQNGEAAPFTSSLVASTASPVALTAVPRGSHCGLPASASYIWPQGTRTGRHPRSEWKLTTRHT